MVGKGLLLDLKKKSPDKKSNKNPQKLGIWRASGHAIKEPSKEKARRRGRNKIYRRANKRLTM